MTLAINIFMPNNRPSEAARTRARFARFGARCLVVLPLAAGALAAPRAGRRDTTVAAHSAGAQRQKPPSPERIVNDYLAAIGGRKRASRVRDAIYEWAASVGGRETGRARTQTRAPGAARTDITLSGGGEISHAATPRAAWRRDAGGTLRTLTDGEAGAAKLQAVLGALNFVDYQKQNVVARTVGAEQAGGETVYVVEFVRREGGRLSCTFGANSKLLIEVADEGRRTLARFGDYRAPEANGLLVPHRAELAGDRGETFVLSLRAARFNTGLADAAFEPPGEAALDVPALSGQGCAVLMATHDLFRAKESGTRVGIMRHGKLVRELRTEEINHADLERIYLEHMHD